jgi:hypothetical protein
MILKKYIPISQIKISNRGEAQVKKNVTVLLLLLIALSLCSQTKDSELTFSPLKENEVLVVERKKAPLLWDLEVSVINSKSNDKRVIGIYTMFEGTALLNDSMNRFFFTARDKDDNSLLWYVNGEKGFIKKLFHISPRFVISNDGKYLTYYETYAQRKKANREISKITLYNIDKEEVIQEVIPKNTTTSKLNIMSLEYVNKEKKMIVEIGYDDVIVMTEELFIPKE